jgi:hypothetical protein
MTHFVGPYAFTDPTVTAERRAALVRWLARQRDTFGDEIGLHIHPYCSFVESAGLRCVVDQSTVYAEDVTGYTVKVAAYRREPFGRLLEHANRLFEQNGLGRARTFRAGGWTASLETLQALADKGFVADSSALNWVRIEEWKDEGTGELYRWNQANWASIGDTSQPYWPHASDVAAPGPPSLPVLEVPVNGAAIDYVTREELEGLFDANWNRAPLGSPVTLVTTFHPAPGFSEAEGERLDGFLRYVDRHLASRGLGPVVYTTLERVAAAYPK